MFGTTKQKLYDVSTEMRPTSNDFANAWNAGTGLAGSIKNVVGYDAPPAHSVLINKD